MRILTRLKGDGWKFFLRFLTIKITLPTFLF